MRYLEQPSSVCIVFLVGSLIYWLDSQARYWITRKPKLFGFKNSGIAISIFIACSTIGFSAPHWKIDLISVPQDQRQLFQAIKKLPEESVISASYWIIANNIPVFSERAVLVNREVNIPFHRDYYRQMKSRFLDWLNAYYSDSPKVMKSYIKKYQIDYLVMSTWDYTEACIKNRKKHFVKDILPSDFIATALEKQKKGSFWFRDIKTLPIIATAGPYLLINAKRLKTSLQP